MSLVRHDTVVGVVAAPGCRVDDDVNMRGNRTAVGETVVCCSQRSLRVGLSCLFCAVDLIFVVVFRSSTVVLSIVTSWKKLMNGLCHFLFVGETIAFKYKRKE
jgi:hypothetical protein